MPIAAIIEHTHSRLCSLPDGNAARRQQQRDYMRRYMRDVYRKNHVTRNVTLSPDEDRRLQTTAAAYGRKPATLLREAAFAYLEQGSVLPRGWEEALAAFTLEVRRIGTNINQLAHQANLRPETAPAALQRAIALLTELEAAPARHLPAAPSPPAHADQVAHPA